MNVVTEYENALFDVVQERWGDSASTVLDYSRALVSVYAIADLFEISELKNDTESVIKEVFPDYSKHLKSLDSYKNKVKQDLSYMSVGFLPAIAVAANPIVLGVAVGLLGIAMVSSKPDAKNWLKNQLKRLRDKLKRDYRAPKGTPTGPVISSGVKKAVIYSTTILTLGLSKGGQKLMTGTGEAIGKASNIALYVLIAFGLFVGYKAFIE